MILDIAILIVACGNLINALLLFNIANTKHNSPTTVKVSKPKAVKLRKKKKEETMTQEEILLHNIDAYDGTDKGQMEI